MQLRAGQRCRVQVRPQEKNNSRTGRSPRCVGCAPFHTVLRKGTACRRARTAPPPACWPAVVSFGRPQNWSHLETEIGNDAAALTPSNLVRPACLANRKRAPELAANRSCRKGANQKNRRTRRPYGPLPARRRASTSGCCRRYRFRQTARAIPAKALPVAQQATTANSSCTRPNDQARPAAPKQFRASNHARPLQTHLESQVTWASRTAKNKCSNSGGSPP